MVGLSRECEYGFTSHIFSLYRKAAMRAGLIQNCPSVTAGVNCTNISPVLSPSGATCTNPRAPCRQWWGLPFSSPNPPGMEGCVEIHLIRMGCGTSCLRRKKGKKAKTMKEKALCTLEEEIHPANCRKLPQTAYTDAWPPLRLYPYPPP